uniref:Succinate dehydrogenase/fumarate reductase flavoprotein subunit n=1 Tax=uncultured organism TaxID=155900 RepID=M1P0Y2_9ZZZZ|nr:succinate dehydrogenase/fumarate reductase flavoprotein subunit [uncultured organism]
MSEGYPDYMEESIKKVEETRAERIDKTPDRMDPDEADEVLNNFHPDYKPEGKKKLQMGPSKDRKVPNEVSELLEAHSLIEPSDIDLNQVDYDVDVLIIGGGGAGTVASLWAVKEGIDPENILISTKLRHGDSNSMMAQGGIQVADREDDSPPRHYLDVIGGGHFTNEPELVKALTRDAPKVLDWHEDLGMMYDREDDGNFVELPGGGTSRYRLHSAGDYTGMELMRVLRDEARNLDIPVLEFTPAVELLKDDKGQVAGAVLMNLETNEYYVVRAKSTIMATGGFGRLHVQSYPTTNHYGATADGLVMGYRAGVPIRDLDSVQYHPTGAAHPDQIVGLLVTEKVRSLGAQPVNCDGELFVNPMEPRDIEAASLIRECHGRNNGVKTPTGMKGVWLDSPLIEEKKGEGTIEENLPAMVRLYERFGIDMTEKPILVFPTLHYQNGGLEINSDASTPVPGLFAGGEVEGGVHGKNRLMGNSLLDYNVFGRRAGINAARHAKKASIGELTLDHVQKYEDQLDDAGIDTDRKSPMLLPEYRGENVLNRHLDIDVTL